MARMVQCAKLGKELEGLEKPPYRNELGQRIFENISKDAWKMWLEHFKMIMNEMRLDPSNPHTMTLMFREAEKFLFTDTAAPPEGYVPPKS